jgi:structure-specific recognition protein 1
MSGNPIFSALNKEELTSITEFLTMKKIKVKNEMEELAAAEAEALGGAMEDDSDDDDAMSIDSDDDDRPKKRQSAKATGPATIGQMGDDEDSEGGSLLVHTPPLWVNGH